MSVRILRRHWAVVLLLALMFVGPGALLTSAAGVELTEVLDDVIPRLTEGDIGDDLAITQNQAEAFTAAGASYLLAWIVAGLLASIGALAFSAVVAADYHARPVELGDALRAALRRAGSAIAFMLITALAIVGIVLSGLAAMIIAGALLPSGPGGGPGAFLALVVFVAMAGAVIYLTLRWAPAYPSMVEEGLGWRQTLRRSWFLSADNVWRIFLVIAFGLLATGLMAAALSSVLSIVTVGALAPALGLDPVIVQTVTFALGSVLLAPLLPVLTAVLFFDLRARRDVPATAESVSLS